MNMNGVVPPSNISSGVDVEERSFTWTIGNFPLLRKHKEMIDSQTFPFTAGETKGHPSQWKVFLQESKKDDKRRIGIFLGPTSPKPTDAAFKAAYSEFRCTIKNKEGKIIKNRVCGPMHIATHFAEVSGGWGFPDFIYPDDANLYPEESLEIQITFKLYTSSPAKVTSSLEAIKEKFGVKFLDQLRKDVPDSLDTPDPSTDIIIKIISNDKTEFSMRKGILAARSEVFAAMLRSDMVEGNSGVIKLPKISSKALKVFLHFLKTGVLLPEWSEPGVILELTNAAEEYQRKDLLQFLDEVMGKVCQLENVLDLAVLARQLSLKVAGEELMGFVRKEGFGSLDKVFQMWNTEVPGIESAPTSTAAANKGKN